MQFSSAQMQHLWKLWRAARPSPLPTVTTFLELCSALNDDLILAERTGLETFVYRRVGESLVNLFGRDLSGHVVAADGGARQQYIAECYEQSISEARPIHMVCGASDARLVRKWQRLVLPLADDNGDPRFVLCLSKPVEFTHNLLSRALANTSDVIVGLAVDEAKQVPEDFIVEFANHSALGLLGIDTEEVAGRRLSSLLPRWRATRIGKTLLHSVASGQKAQLVWRTSVKQEPLWFKVTIDVAGDGAVVTMSDISDLKRSIRIAQRLNYQLRRELAADNLTKAASRSELLRIGHREFQRATRHKTPLTVLYFDLDRLKDINDHFGHSVGDAAILKVAQITKNTLRVSDYLGRLSGDEFAVVLPHTSNVSAYETAERIRNTLNSNPVSVDDTTVFVTCSFGVASLDHGDSNFREILDRADRAMLSAKSAGRNRIEPA